MATDMTNAPSYARAAVANAAKTAQKPSTGSTISSQLTTLGQGLIDTYKGYTNAQIAAANMANAWSAKAQADQFKYNTEMMNLQNEKQDEYFQKQLEFNAQSAKEANAFTEKMFNMAKDFNAAEAEKNRNWESEMSNTAWQRAVADMKASGINPILAAQQGGASTPGGTSASINSGSGAMTNASSANAAGGSVGNYSGQGYHLSDSMAIMGSILGALGAAISGKAAENGGILSLSGTVERGINNFLDTAKEVISDENRPKWLGVSQWNRLTAAERKEFSNLYNKMLTNGGRLYGSDDQRFKELSKQLGSNAPGADILHIAFMK